MEAINYGTKRYPKIPDTYIIREHNGDRVSSPEAALSVFRDALKDLDAEREHFLCISLNTKNQQKSLDIISIGSLNANIVHPREVFYTAIAHRAAAIIVAHNHPSGDPAPSQNDIDITRKLKAAGEIVGIEVYDHIIFGEDEKGTWNYISMKEQGLVWDRY